MFEEVEAFALAAIPDCMVIARMVIVQDWRRVATGLEAFALAVVLDSMVIVQGWRRVVPDRVGKTDTAGRG